MDFPYETTDFIVESDDSPDASVVVVDSGGAATPDEEGEGMAYSKRVDFVSDSLIYRAEAMPGTSDSSPGWRIREITIAEDGDIVEKWANGSANFNQVWTDRASLSYV